MQPDVRNPGSDQRLLPHLVISAAVLDELKRRQILRVYTLEVLSDLENGGVNRNKVWINIGMEPIGHMEQFWYEIGVGVILGAEE